jgi:hypothetical protein
MAEERTLFDKRDIYHFTGYKLFLLMGFVPFYLYLKIIDYPLNELKEAASFSWMLMAKHFPDFATGIYVYARTLSAILGALTVFLVYLLGKEIEDKETGLFSAIFLSVSMGFIGVNHFAKYISFLNLLVVGAVFFVVRFLNQRNGILRNFIAASFIAGYAVSTNPNGAILLFVLILSFILKLSDLHKERINILSIIFKAVFFYILGIIFATPSLITNFDSYFLLFIEKLRPKLQLVNVAREGNIFAGPLNIFFEVWSIYGFFIFSLMCSGIVYTLINFRKIRIREWPLLTFIFIYFFIVAILLEDKYPQTKYIIAVIPFLSIYAGRAMRYIFSLSINIIFKYLIFFVVFFYSFAYSLCANRVFLKDDTRYKATEWIVQNIPANSKIELFQQIAYICSDSIMDDYEIIYLGRSSRIYKGKHFFKWDTVKDIDLYFKKLNKQDSSSDYIIFSTYDKERIFTTDYMSYISGLSQYLKDLFSGKKNFKLIKVIYPKNRKIKSKTIKGFIHFQNLFWNPVPSYRATAHTIYIFKRDNERST